MINRLFVYGSLAPGGQHADLLKTESGVWQRAFVYGKICVTGTVASGGYPVLVLDSSGIRVNGWLFSSPTAFRLWSRLDDFEGNAYRRVVVCAYLSNGNRCKAWVYEYRFPLEVSTRRLPYRSYALK